MRHAWPGRRALKIYRKALRQARKDYYPVLIEENKIKPRILFSTVSRLTESNHSIEPCIPRAVNCYDFMNFFFTKYTILKSNILHSTDSSSVAGIIKAVSSPDVCLQSFHPIDLHALIPLHPSKLSTCILDPILTRLLKEVLSKLAIHS